MEKIKSEKKVTPQKRGGSYLVTKSNFIVEASYRLTLQEQRLVLWCVAQIDSRRPLDEQRKFVVNAGPFRETWGISRVKVYEELKEAVNRLYSREVTIVDGQNGLHTRLRWVSQIQYHDNEGYATLNFAPEMLPFISALKDRFTSYPLQSIAGLTSTFAIRLFEILIQYAKLGRRHIPIEQLRRWLDCVDTYPRPSEFERWVVAPSVAQLNKRTELRVRYDKLTSGRNTTGYEFHIGRAEATQQAPVEVVTRAPPVDTASAQLQWEADMRKLGLDPAAMLEEAKSRARP